MADLFIVKQYLKYLWRAKNLHGVHSPFVYSFNKDIVNEQKQFYAFEQIAAWRKQLLQNHETVSVTDFGAGSKNNSSNLRKISEIAHLAGKRAKDGELLYKMVDAYNCKNILELGTSLGIGTSYLASANRNAKVTTIEGCPNIAALAKKHFNDLALSNIKQLVGNFDVVLPELLATLPKFDFVFIDGNHRYQPTINYLEWILPHLAKDAIVVLDDVHWSKEMLQAWNKIIADARVPLTIDVFQFGICVWRNSFKEKQHFVIKH